MISSHCTTLFEHVLSMRTSYFEMDFASQMKLTKFTLIHCFEGELFCKEKKRKKSTKMKNIFMVYCGGSMIICMWGPNRKRFAVHPLVYVSTPSSRHPLDYKCLLIIDLAWRRRGDRLLWRREARLSTWTGRSS